MLRLGAAFLSPLRTRSEDPLPMLPETPLFSSLQGSQWEAPPPENYARDALMEVMRRATEAFKEADTEPERLQQLQDVLRIMADTPEAKDIFRQSDGFLAIVNMLSNLRYSPHPGDDTPRPGQATHNYSPFSESLRMVFMVLCEAMKNHPANAYEFETLVGYDVFRHTLEALISFDKRTIREVSGYLLCLATENFGLVNCFEDDDDVLGSSSGNDRTGSKVTALDPDALSLHNPAAILCMIELQRSFPSASVIATTFKIVERMVFSSHRNQALLNQAGLCRLLSRELSSSPSILSVHDTASIQRTLRRVLEIGLNFDEAEEMFKAMVIQSDSDSTPPSLNGEVLECVKGGMRTAGIWPQFISFGGGFAGKSGIELENARSRGRTFPSALGYTYMAWVYIERLPTHESAELHLLHAHSTSPSRLLCSLQLLPSGHLSYMTSSMREPLIIHPLPEVKNGVSTSSEFPLQRWVNIVLIHHPRSSFNLRIFVDGALFALQTSPYPKGSPPPVTFFIGNNLSSQRRDSTSSPSTRQEDNKAGGLWYIASAHLVLDGLPNEIPRLIYTLGPRYHGNFLGALAGFLTYQSATSLNINLSQMMGTDRGLTIMKALNSGFVKEENMAFGLSAVGVCEDPERPGVKMLVNTTSNKRREERASLVGNANVLALGSLEAAMWRLGGATIPLELVALADNERDLAHAIAVLDSSIGTSWQNSEDMERIHGYDILMAILRRKIHLINLQTFHLLFKILGIDYGDPENSTIINAVAYRTIALDFAFWSQVPLILGRLHLSHFQTVLQVSRFKVFNAKSRFNKFGAVKRILFVIQTPMYKDDLIRDLIDALMCIVKYNFSAEATIKPLVSYLAANLEVVEPEWISVVASSAPVTPIEQSNSRERAERILDGLIALLDTEVYLTKFRTAVPTARVCTLLLGTRPRPVVIAQILHLATMILRDELDFVRKLESAHFFSLLKMNLPRAWDVTVHVAAFDLLLGRANASATPTPMTAPVVSCPQILPAIFATLEATLVNIARSRGVSNGTSSAAPSSCADTLVEELIDLHSTSPSFRKLFQTKPLASQFIELCRLFINQVTESIELRSRTARIVEKLTHLALIIALHSGVDAQQKEELMGVIRATQVEQSMGLVLPDLDTCQPTPLVRRRSLALPGAMRLDPRPLLNQRSLSYSVDRTSSWRQTIIAAEQKRLRKGHQDLKEYSRYTQSLAVPRNDLYSEAGLWPQKVGLTLWQLDDTEGPVRIRKKLQPFKPKGPGKDLLHHLQESSSMNDGGASGSQSDRQSWAETKEGSSVNLDDDQRWGEDTAEDKHRRVRHELEPGDIIEDVQTVTRIVGVNASPGLLIVGKTHLYMLEGLVQDEEHGIMDARDAPKDILSVPGTLLDLDGSQRAQRWPLDHVSSFSKRTYLFRDVGLEMYFKDSRSILVVFSNKSSRQSTLAKFDVAKMQGLNVMSPIVSATRAPLISRVSESLSSAFQGHDEMASAQRKWQNREISNYTYLSLINQASGRTPNDLTQYPVFPWVLQDYTSERLDLTSPESFRNLTKPIGALTETKRTAAETRYLNLEQVDEPPFNYGTHFSSSMIVSHFLIRLAPFSHYFKVLQGGDWDLPDRLFIDIKRAWDSASQDSRGDVRELIGEFYTCPEFLINLSKLDFGVQTGTEERIDSVKLPPWAKDDPYLFVTLHRQALESEHVSSQLPAWIDLIWGCKQRDRDSVNVHHPLSYEGAIDLDTIIDPLKKEATAGIIHNFGQTPRKVFSAPHPPREMNGHMSLPYGVSMGIPENCQLLQQSSRPERVIDSRVDHLSVDLATERIIACRGLERRVPSDSGNGNEHVEWGFPDKSFRVFAENKLVQVIEALSVTCCDLPDSDSLVTGLDDATVCIWRFDRREGTSLRLANVMRGHRDPATCIASSRSWSLVVTGSSDCTVILWDLNRGQYVRRICHESEVLVCAIQESLGCIATCSREVLAVYTVNAHLIASVRLPAQQVPRSLTFHEREWSPVPILASGATDGTITIRTWNADSTEPGEKAKWEFITLHTLRCREENGVMSSVESLRFASETLWHGDNAGNTYQWLLSANH
ncbi:hypothetical protein FRB94_005904 [Tulasnella sp. JGI-2019a]|nr:hypothetical protein FRB93_006158 [Tulasnella sp. JGI-2019a]KAG8999816.1 hypothetical protein FRB94_005904 [Tulasnella sp. JGI-2019a]KAG9029072.1 hypothetical protein FRB95_005767 [Tulasnella sp. JGI-2019a]